MAALSTAVVWSFMFSAFTPVTEGHARGAESVAEEDAVNAFFRDLAGERSQLLVDGVWDSLKPIRPILEGTPWHKAGKGVQEAVNGTIGAIEGIEVALREDHQRIQRKIDDSIKDVLEFHSNAVVIKKVADAKDNELLQCRYDEKVWLSRISGDIEDLMRLKDRKDKLCKEMDEAVEYSWALYSEVPTHGQCEFKEVGCPSWDEFEAQFNPWVARVDNSKRDYHGKAQACEAARNAFIEERAEPDESRDVFLGQRAKCDALQRRVSLAMCEFGDRLQQKCAAKSSLDYVISMLVGTGSNSAIGYDLAKREKQWDTSQRIKCLLREYRAGRDVSYLLNNTAPENVDTSSVEFREGRWAKRPCDSLTDYKKGVGELNLRGENLGTPTALGTSDKEFSCQEERIAFSGSRWATGNTLPEYQKQDYSASVTIAPLGVEPFDFCPSPLNKEEVVSEAALLHGNATADLARRTAPARPSSLSFSTCKASGPFGPTQRACDIAYAGSAVEDRVTVAKGYQLWTADVAGEYTFTVVGANGGRIPPEGSPGKGAVVVATYRLEAGSSLVLVVGQHGADGDKCSDGGGGGGGGTFVGLLGSGGDKFDTTAPGEIAGQHVQPLLVAGGGAGNDDDGWAECKQKQMEGLDGDGSLGGGQEANFVEESGCISKGAGLRGIVNSSGASLSFLRGAIGAEANGWRKSGAFGGGAGSCHSGGAGGGYWGGASPQTYGGLWSGVRGGTSFVNQDFLHFVQGSATSGRSNPRDDGDGYVQIQGSTPFAPPVTI